MKHANLPVLLIFLNSIFALAQCKNNKPDSNGLPAATQEGKNTLGFLLNGQPWTPQGNNGTANLSIYYDETFSAGVFNISSYRILNSSNGTRQRITFYGDTIQNAQKIVLPSSGKFGLIFKNDITSCDYDASDTSVKIISGFFDIKKLDKANRFFSAEFDIKFKKTGCENVQISQGRLDLKF